MTAVIVTLFVITILVLVHELGHALAAKLLGMSVVTFSVGFGKRILERRFGDTIYCLSAIPLGGYVRIYVPDRNEKEAVPAKDRTLLSKVSANERALIAELNARVDRRTPQTWRKALAILAGPVANILFCLSLFTVWPWLVPAMNAEHKLVVGAVKRQSPVEKAGVKVGDKIVAINGKPVVSHKLLRRMVKNSGGRHLRVDLIRLIDRDPHTVKVQLSPERSGSRYKIGVDRFEHIVFYFPDFQGGVINLAQEIGKAYRRGWNDLTVVVGELSVLLALVNLLPIPPTDGGELVLLAGEACAGREISASLKTTARSTGLIGVNTLTVAVLLMEILLLSGFW